MTPSLREQIYERREKRLEKKVNQLVEYYKNYGRDERFAKKLNAYIKSCSCLDGNGRHVWMLTYAFTRLSGLVDDADASKLIDEIRYIGSAAQLYNLATNGLTRDLLSEDDIKKLANRMCQLTDDVDNGKYLYRFAVNVKGVNINKFYEAIKKTNNHKFIKAFEEKFIENTDVEKVETDNVGV